MNVAGTVRVLNGLLPENNPGVAMICDYVSLYHLIKLYFFFFDISVDTKRHVDKNNRKYNHSNIDIYGTAVMCLIF